MLDFFYNLSPSIFRSVLYIIVLLFLFLVNHGVSRYCAKNNNDHDGINGASATVSMMYAVFLGFVIFSSVNNMSTADDSARQEAHLVSTIAYEGSLVSQSFGIEVTEIMRHYLHQVINEEWPVMQQGAVHPIAISALVDLKQVLTKNKPNSSSVTVDAKLWTNMVENANALYQAHETRMSYANSPALSSGIWYCLVVATLILLTSNSLFFFEDRRKKIILLICIGMITALLLFLEANINFPYRGHYALSSHYFQDVLSQLDKW